MDEFREALETYKRVNGRPFPTWSEVLAVAKSLGYRSAKFPDIVPVVNERQPTPDDPLPVVIRCSAEGCRRTAMVKGMCSMHYKRGRRNEAGENLSTIRSRRWREKHRGE